MGNKYSADTAYVKKLHLLRRNTLLDITDHMKG